MFYEKNMYKKLSKLCHDFNTFKLAEHKLIQILMVNNVNIPGMIIYIYWLP